MTSTDHGGAGLALAVETPDAENAVRRVDHDALERAARDLLVALGADISADGLRDTPRRVADAYTELLTPEPFTATTFPNDGGYDELVVVRAIPFHSLCMHHLLPFHGVAHVGYLPGERIIGLSKLGRVVEHFSRDLQIQERLTTQVADWLERELQPKGVGVVLEAEHLCMSLRGVQTHGATTVTSALRGLVRSDARTRQELLSLATMLMSAPDRLRALHDAGVSIWLDSLSRDLLDTGDLAHLIKTCSVTGATSNPTIFAKAISASDRYDDQLRAAAAAGTRDPQELFFDLALDDVGRAADLLLGAYGESGGNDGFVSFECTPDLAYDAQGTVDQALALWARLDRPNVMIKVPATDAGILAIEELTFAGVNVNVTLLFAIARYEQVIEAYLTGLERRLASGQRVAEVASVASFFVSRVDTNADALLPADSDLRGRVAVANARCAYALYGQRLASARWRSLALEGARPQRPLWASTATKNSAYSDLVYVEELVTPDAINTMPLATLRAFADDGDPAHEARGDAAAVLEAAAAAVDLDAITSGLERDGVHAFRASYHELLELIESKVTGKDSPPLDANRREGPTTRSEL